MTVCAFLNQRGGHVLIGVTPEGEVVGQQVSGSTVERLSGDLRRIEPAAFPTVERIRVAGDRHVIVVRVNTGAAGTVYVAWYCLPSRREHHRGHVGRGVPADAVRTHAQRATVGEPACRRVVDRRPRRSRDSEHGCRGGAAGAVGGAAEQGAGRHATRTRTASRRSSAASSFGAVRRRRASGVRDAAVPASRRPLPRRRSDGVPGQSPIQRQCVRAVRCRAALSPRDAADRRAVRAGPVRANRRAALSTSGHTRGFSERAVPS